MRADVPPFEVMRHTLWLGERPVETDPRMRRVAECIADIRPAIERLSRTYWRPGHRLGVGCDHRPHGSGG